MCRRVQCERCRKPTYAGCGKHIEQVLRGIGQAERCMCRQVSQVSVPSVLLTYEPSVITEEN
jgi:hypothetical protein